MSILPGRKTFPSKVDEEAGYSVQGSLRYGAVKQTLIC
jgi:hypothetical protein